MAFKTNNYCLIYRCLVPECETSEYPIYDADFTKWAIPDKSSVNQVIGVKTDLCSRYRTKTENHNCTPDAFTTIVESCTQFVFEPTERTIVKDVSIYLYSITIVDI